MNFSHHRALWVMVLAAVVAAGGVILWRERRTALRWYRRVQLPRTTWIAWHDPEPVQPFRANADEERSGFVAFQRPTLEPVYERSVPRRENVDSTLSLQVTRDEYEPVQVAVHALRSLSKMEVGVSDLRDDDGHVLPASQVVVRMVRYYGAQLAQERPDLFAVVPKTLEVAAPIDIAEGHTRPYWITVHVPADQPGGHYRGTATFQHGGGGAEISLSVEVIPITLDEPDILYGTASLNTLRAIAQVRPARAATIAQHADIIFRDQRAHGMSSVSLWSGKAYEERDGHPYLQDLELAMRLYHRYDFMQPMIYAPVNLLKTNKLDRAENYRRYDAVRHGSMARAIATYYTQRFREERLPGIVFIPVEEPSLRTGISWSDAPDTRQRLARDLTHAMKEAGAATGLTCTPESVRAAMGDLDLWIVAYRKFDPTLYAMAEQAHAKLGIYANTTMMGNGTYFTRFLFGYFVWANHVQAMLPWTYPMQPKRFPQNLGGRGEGALHVKDGFLGVDGQPIPTVQWELSREGIDDAKYLVTIDRLAREARADGTVEDVAAAAAADAWLASVRAAVEKDVRHYTFADPDTLQPMPQDGWTAERFEQLHDEAGLMLQRLLAIMRHRVN
ncbi:MAG: hypothetical protein HYR72_09610 [Deltaproteobacteria bacterium]|nr:hypothetical protein [Deltaproteobacteria bacterium]MBI3387954.1 hypothetical protein [Deltaproteobacteria bacterium]